MEITKLYLSNYKNFNEITVDFSNLTVFIGANASGKSNLISALKFIRDIKEFGIANAISLQGGIEYLKNINLKDKTSTIISVEIALKGGKVLKIIDDNSFIGLHNIKFNYTIEIGVKNRKKFEILREEYKYNTQIKILNETSDSKSTKNKKLIGNNCSDPLTHTITKKKNSEPTVDYFPKGEIEINFGKGKYKIDEKELESLILPVSLIQHASKEQKNKTLLELYPFILPEINTFNFAIYDFDLNNAKQPATISGKEELEENGNNLALVLKSIFEDREKKSRFKNLISDILPFINNISCEKFYGKSFLLKIHEVFNPKSEFPSSLLSDGTISIVSMITALFFERKSVVIFEEPEKGVHPAIISVLMQYFYEASHKKQVIITTHSPEILKNSKIEDVHFITRDRNGSSTFIKPNEKKMVKQFLKNQIGIDQLFIQNLLDN